MRSARAVSPHMRSTLGRHPQHLSECGADEWIQLPSSTAERNVGTAHAQILRFYVHTVAAPEEAGDVFFGVTEASLPWLCGKTEGVDVTGRVRSGRAPLATAMRRTAPSTAPVAAPKTATFVVQINFTTNVAWIGAYETTPARRRTSTYSSTTPLIFDVEFGAVVFTMGAKTRRCVSERRAVLTRRCVSVMTMPMSAKRVDFISSFLDR